MSGRPRHLAAVDKDTGELRLGDECPNCVEYRSKMEMYERDLIAVEKELRAKRSQIKALRHDKERARTEYARRQDVVEVFEYWKAKVKGPKSRAKLTTDRFDAVKHRLEEKGEDAEGYTVEQIKWAIDFIAANPFVVNSARVPHGKRQERHDDLELICRTGSRLEKWANEGYLLQKETAPQPEG